MVVIAVLLLDDEGGKLLKVM